VYPVPLEFDTAFFRFLYERFGPSWWVPASTSMLNPCNPILRPGDPSAPLSAASLPSWQRDPARTACLRAGVVIPVWLEACAVDVAVLGTASAAADPGPQPAVLGGQGDGGHHRLVAEFGEGERAHHGPERRPSAARGLALVPLGEAVPAQGPGTEAEEGQPARQRDPAAGKGGAESMAYGDGDQMHRGRGDGDAGQHRRGPVAGREGQRHQLRFVAELGYENDAEANRQRHQKSLHRVLPGRSHRVKDAKPRPGKLPESKVSLTFINR
jgi:hypothetical protein